MSSIKLLFVILLFICFTGSKLFSQDMTPPKPVDNKVYESMVGVWTGENSMMGMKMNETVTVKWGLNHQFVIFDYKATSKDNAAMSYNGLGIYGVDANGNALGWWFDDWGATSMATGSGTFSENKLEMNSSNAMFKENRVFEVKGNDMTMTAKGSYSVNGKDVPFNETNVYKKK